MTAQWQEFRGSKEYRFQTDEKEIYVKVKRRNGYRCIGSSMTSNPSWLFKCSHSRPDIAKKTFKSIVGLGEVKIDSEGIIYRELMK